jgi:hypothetical protein
MIFIEVNCFQQRNKKGYFSYEPLYVGYRAYNLIWDYDDEETDQTLIIINCYREKQFDIKSRNYYEQ